ncbi:TIGR03985 family CRISPR-associated protein [Geitlerinema splendidum]|nr:TIGR03985 family CRISPR-associated protein [Geitlerinema splendidum]
MSAEQFFPTVQRLEKLVPELLQVSHHNPSLQAKSNCLMLLASGARRWVILRSLYDCNSDFFIDFESDLFNCADWLNKFKRAIINYQSYTLEYWLFSDYTGVIKTQFVSTLKSRYKLEDEDIQELFSTLIFCVTDRTFRNQFTQLAKLKNQFLERKLINQKTNSKKQVHKFHKRLTATILELLATEQSSNFDGLLEFLTNEVSAIAELLVAKVNGEQRLFIHHEYVVNEDQREASADLADRLKEIWKIAPTPPIQITYYSAYLNQTRKYIIYPVCLYYYQRAYYLCSFGERPQRTENQPQVGWYNYRLERINKLKTLSWDTPNLPLPQSEIINHPENYSPDYIQQELDSAYGFDFYENASLMLLRFGASFAQRYIDNSFRHPTFTKLDSYQDALALIGHLKLPNPRKVLAHINQYPDAAYYTLRYRQNENNVIMRLQAWGPRVEVVFPLELRQIIRQEIEQTWQLYKDPLN